MTPWLDTVDLSGVVVVACHGRPVYSVARGQANRATGTPNTLDTRFNLGSMNKMWTAIAVAQLVEQGKIDLKAPVGRYLPSIANPAIRDQIQVHHLLTHTSGLGVYFTRGFLRDRIYANRASDYLPFFIEDAPAFSPGARMQYSNAGFALLGAIVEAVSGQSYFDYMQKNVLGRAKMSATAFDDVRTLTPGMAIPYGTPPGAQSPTDTSSQIEARGGPAGGAFATAADVVAFSRALWSGTLVNAALVKEFTTGKVAMGPTVKYAYGFGEGALNGWRHVGHNGGMPGVGAEFLSFPDQDIDLVVLTNMDMPVATQAMSRLSLIVTGANVATVGASGPAAPVAAARLHADGWPDSVHGRRAADFFSALKAGGADYATFIESQMVPTAGRSTSERAQGAAGLRENFGAFTLTRVLAQTATSLQVLMASEKQGPVRFIIDFEPQAPQRILLIDMKPGGTNPE